MSDNGKRYNKGKLPLELISPHATKGLGAILRHGAEKYAPRNWEKGLSWSETLGSLKRHINELELGHDIDDGPDGSGLPHVDGIQVNAMFLAHFFHTKTGTDDRQNKAGQPVAGAVKCEGGTNCLCPPPKTPYACGETREMHERKMCGCFQADAPHKFYAALNHSKVCAHCGKSPRARIHKVKS